MATWSVRSGRFLVGALALVGGAGALSPGTAEGTGSNDHVIVLLDPEGSTGLVTSLLQTASWVVEEQDTSAGLLRVRKNGILAWSVGTIVSALEALGVVRAAESLVSARHHPDYQGQQSVPVLLDDDLSAATIRTEDAFVLMNVPTAPPSPSSTTPRIAFLDGGFQLDHEAFPVARLAEEWDAMDHDADAEDFGNDVDDDGDGLVDSGKGHGLGMVAAALVVCPHADIYCARVLDDEGRGDTWSVANGLAWAMSQGVDVISLCFGMSGYSDVIDLMLQDAANQGIVVVASAGNQGAASLAFPANLSHVLAVSGTEEDGDAHTVANFHADTWMSAPSRNVPGPDPDDAEGYGWWSGTSVSCALAAGTLALAIGEDPGDPWETIEDLEADALAFGTLPEPRVGKQGVGIFDVGAVTAP
ncbi:MAG: S8 family serine peptidase [Planctomycetota bacterium]